MSREGRTGYSEQGVHSKWIQVPGHGAKQQMVGVTPHENEEENIRGVAVIPFCSSVTNRVARLLMRWNIKTVSHPPKKLG